MSKAAYGRYRNLCTCVCVARYQVLAGGSSGRPFLSPSPHTQSTQSRLCHRRHRYHCRDRLNSVSCLLVGRIFSWRFSGVAEIGGTSEFEPLDEREKIQARLFCEAPDPF